MTWEHVLQHNTVMLENHPIRSRMIGHVELSARRAP